MAIGILPLRREYNFGAVSPATVAPNIPLITLEGGDVFEAATLDYSGVSGSTDPTVEHRPTTVTAMLTWTHSPLDGTPPAPGPVPASNKDTAAYHQTRWIYAGSAGQNWLAVIDSIRTDLSERFTLERSTLWFVLQNNFTSGSGNEAWEVNAIFRVWYRAPQDRQPQ